MKPKRIAGVLVALAIGSVGCSTSQVEKDAAMDRFKEKMADYYHCLIPAAVRFGKSTPIAYEAAIAAEGQCAPESGNFRVAANDAFSKGMYDQGRALYEANKLCNDTVQEFRGKAVAAVLDDRAKNPPAK